MPFGLKNMPIIFSCIVIAVFKEYIHKFLEVYLDDWFVFGLVKHHVASLRLMLDTCCGHQIALDLKKCTFLVLFGNLLRRVVYKQGLMVEPAKSSVILNLEAPKSVNNCTLPWDTSDTTESLTKAMPKSPRRCKSYWKRMLHFVGMTIVWKVWTS